MSDETEWPEGWLWYRNEGGPYLVHPRDCELTIPQIARLLKFHSLHIVTEAEKRVLDAMADVEDIEICMTLDLRDDLSVRETRVWEAELARRTP